MAKTISNMAAKGAIKSIRGKDLGSLNALRYSARVNILCNENPIITKRGFSLSRHKLAVNVRDVEAEKTFKNERDVPFLFLPHTVKKAYVVHEAMTSIPQVFDKYKWLTKTISTPGLPVTYDEKVVEKEFVEAFHDSLQQAVSFQKSYRNKNQSRYINERIEYNMLINFIRLSMMVNSNLDHLSGDNSILYHNPLLETHWPRNYKFFQTKFRPTFVLRTKKRLEAIEKSEGLTQDEVDSIPGPYDNYALNVYRQHIVHLHNRPAMDNSTFNPIKHPHTTVISNSRIRTQEQFLSCATFSSFAQLIAQAQTVGTLHGTDLKEPLLTQCVVTNGHRICFMVYQLNTLHLTDDKGLWNRCWYSPVLDMYERKNTEDHLNLIFEDAIQSTKLEGFNETICKYFFNFFSKE
ncbi:uncharacterized protein LOC130647527 [Hydractinia symbiolongicarpus]|uniref:uncharacterized protein LOC130647527 n=1 Tax=Hydractinia symbiolongicarpus TaxID=13093 RepID=UPI00254D6A92|nr:uncharacterized protein LOC130647527 [Hydractinia symbiolongicarpus]